MEYSNAARELTRLDPMILKVSCNQNNSVSATFYRLEFTYIHLQLVIHWTEDI